ncbi:hypothetical protein EG329_006501 [Mollisiaceae sp. DMI_Dod_QoI]|nr:hypothetical protein EG329_006501 [Helotiales sp. DMI_Dod_QoI]
MATPEWFQGFLNPGMVVIRKYLEITSNRIQEIIKEKRIDDKIAGTKLFFMSCLNQIFRPNSSPSSD